MTNGEIMITFTIKKNSCFASIILLFVLLVSCSSYKQFKAPEPPPDDTRNIPQPEEQKINIYSEYFNKQITKQIAQSFDLSRQLRNLFGKRKEAKNVDAFGEVINSSWFTNRNAYKRMSLEEIARGPDKGTGPDTSDVWIITRAKAEGVTPGFTIKDKQGDNYVVKFDPPGYPELASGAEVISTKLFYAIGYNVPENYVTCFHPRILKLGENVKFTDKKGRKRNMNNEDLKEILNRIHYLPDGRIRALASKYIPGRPIGPFKYKGTRKDDPNDLIPHQYRRELRGLRVISAWLNHFDTKDGNTLDSYVTEGGVGYVKHFLIDFGATLGSASHGPNHLWRGFKNDIDPHVFSQNLVTLGFYVHPWEKQEGVKYHSVGIFESELFSPHKYKPQVPNPAFENLTNLDGYWGAKMVISFTDEQLKKVVAEAQYSDPEAEAYIIKTLIKRRDKVGQYYFNKVIPLDKFELRETENEKKQLCFVDMAVETGLESASQVQYRYELRCDGELILNTQDLGSKTCLPLPEKRMVKQNPEGKSGSTYKALVWEFKLQLKRSAEKKWSKWVKVYLHSDNSLNKLELIGIRRQ